MNFDPYSNYSNQKVVTSVTQDNKLNELQVSMHLLGCTAVTPVTLTPNHWLSDDIIEQAKMTADYDRDEAKHEHNDCIRMAYEWLTPQTKIKYSTTDTSSYKGLIEEWAGRYVSRNDLEIAAYLHPDINGEFPYYNISKRLTEPSIERLACISEAFKHGFRRWHKRHRYKYYEHNGIIHLMRKSDYE